MAQLLVMIMGLDEKICAHIVSVWRESKKFLSIHGKEGMLVLTDKHLAFVYKTDAKMKWWQAIVARQVVMFLRSKSVMNIHDGYSQENLVEDMENKKNIVLLFDDILDISYEDKTWGSVLFLEYQKDGKIEKHDYSIVQDWVKYPAKAPTKYMKVDWEPFVKYIKDRQRITR